VKELTKEDYDLNKNRDIPNPSGSINYNCLIKIDNFSEDYPYLLYKDSRTIGLINCKHYIARTLLKDITYQRCGNLYSLE